MHRPRHRHKQCLLLLEYSPHLRSAQKHEATVEMHAFTFSLIFVCFFFSSFLTFVPLPLDRLQGYMVAAAWFACDVRRFHLPLILFICSLISLSTYLFVIIIVIIIIIYVVLLCFCGSCRNLCAFLSHVLSQLYIFTVTFLLTPSAQVQRKSS
uniref:Uncharacterized protein TCIL3000_6_4230 n=1 Tax=Trypanosoma congolense (strain IL3000) TaxID=1068625 RepID=G0UP56_TRYCI|nr:unnamed protein product [Trypanosoma congolense IL3000]